MTSTWNHGLVNQPTLQEMAFKYVFEFVDDEDAPMLRWNLLQEMRRRFPFDAISQALTEAHELAAIMGVKPQDTFSHGTHSDGHQESKWNTRRAGSSVP